MATIGIDTPSYPDRSSSPVRCAAQELNAEQRQHLALQVLARTEPVTELAERHQVSRRFIYQQAAKGAQGLAQAFAPRPRTRRCCFTCRSRKPGCVRSFWGSCCCVTARFGV